jgi:serine/threonine protein kinase
MGPSDLVGQVLDEKYLIERQLGKGGMGAVYLATHLGTDRPVAIKVIAPQYMANDEFVERFRREARAAGRLRHPNVVDVTDFGFARVNEQRIAYLVMEYLDGCTLADVLAEESRLPVGWVVDILEQTCSAVDEAHKRGIIHRDLKPENIWLEPNQRGGYTVKVLDFGLAKLADPAVVELASSFESLLSSLQGASRATVAEQATATDQGMESSEALTQIQTPATTAERQAATTGDHRPTTTAISAAADDRAEAVTQVMPAIQDTCHGFDAGVADEDKTQILTQAEAGKMRRQAESRQAESRQAESRQAESRQAESRQAEDAAPGGLPGDTVQELRAAQTAPADGLTRVGSILGTPIYMSPEQIKSQPPSARSDIYSLGVIAYQMLAGTPPFTGDMHQVMRDHVEQVPPPLKERRPEVPRAMARLVTSALAKDPDARPATAAGFGAAMRASIERTGALLRRAFALYSEHFPPFFRVSLISQLPVVLLSIAHVIFEWLSYRHQIGPTATSAGRALLLILVLCVTFVATAILTGVTIRLVTQLFLAPMRAVQLRPAFAALRRRLWPLLITTILVGLGSLLGLVLLVVPGIIFLINSSLAAPVVMMEDLSGFAARRRSKALVKRSRPTVIAIICIQYLIPMFINSLVSTGIVTAFKGMNAGHANLVGALSRLIVAIFNILIIPLISILTALLYLKTRQMGGETLDGVLSQFEAEDIPHTKWQARMKERSGAHTTPSR